MNRITATAMALAAACITAAAAPRVALVRVKEIYAELPDTALIKDSVKKQRDGIMRDQRADELRRIIAELKELQNRLSDKNNPPDKESGPALARNYEIKRQEAQTLQKEFENFRKQREKEINRAMVVAMRELLDKIVATSGRIAKEQGYDTVLDSSGNTNTGVPFVLYSKESPDLTDAVKAALRDSAANNAK
ncbi:MAG: OmpH family outer membrane protein [Verrucomicrobiales bacterium]|nr:OmpH family outer membrane protein [Verrucomicrobiota bacterium JB025]